MKIKIFLIFLITLGCFLLVPVVEAAELKPTYPRLANYFLKWEINAQEARELAKWDLLILDMEVAGNSPDSLRLIRELNPKVIILGYITTQEIIDDINQAAGYTGAFLRRELKSKINDSWWLRDPAGNRISNWPGTYMLNVSDQAGRDASGKRFNDYLPEFVAEKIARPGYFDGVFYDNTWGDVSWVNNGNLDLNNDGQKDTASTADQAWASGFKKILEKTRSLTSRDFIIVGNGRVHWDYQGLLNGMMLESFPSFWENGGHWSGSMETYTKLPSVNIPPSLPVINVNKKNQTNYQAFRFGLTSTLLGDGFYSFDYDITNHTQTWWYDEYDFNLGPARNQAQNLLKPTSASVWQPGLWRRDFKFGSVFLNSTDKDQLYIFNKEGFEKISGSQDKKINSGEKITYLKLAPQDGIVLLKSPDAIYDSVFVNGYFYRVFNDRGEQLRNGFFSFSNVYPAGAPVVVANSSRSEVEDVSMHAHQGKIFLHKNGRQLTGFSAYDNLFRQQVNLATQATDGFFNLAVVGPTAGGGPQVRLFSADGRLLSSFFAYDKKLRGGVSVALADVDGDGVLEIITGPGRGEQPLVKIFTLAGELKASFLAYDKKFTGGIEVAAGDLNGNGSAEIVTVPGAGGGPQVRIFNSSGRVLGQFFAYQENYREGLKISLSDINQDGQLEILAGVKNFY